MAITVFLGAVGSSLPFKDETGSLVGAFLQLQPSLNIYFQGLKADIHTRLILYMTV